MFRQIFTRCTRIAPATSVSCRYLCATTTSGGAARKLEYTQGQEIDDKQREYFYFIDHQGQLFLDDTKIKNFVTCFKEKVFLRFFFRQLRANTTGRYESDFPYCSPCGAELNFVRCDDLPVVFSQLTTENEPSDFARQRASSSRSAKTQGPQLWYGSDNHRVLSVAFEPSSLFMLPGTGRVYHAAPEKVGGIGLVKSSLAIEFGKQFVYDDQADPETDYPTGFRFQEVVHKLDNKFATHFKYDA